MMEDENRSLDLAMNERGVLKELIETPGWKFLMDIAEAQRMVRSNKILFTPCPADQVTVQEFEKGEVAGITLFTSMPETAIEALSSEIDEHKRRLNLTDEEEEKENAASKAP